MAYRVNDNAEMDPMELLIDKGLEGLPEVLTALINQAMVLERQRHIQAAPFERTADRKDYANGFKPKEVKTRIGALSLQIPQTRHSDFYPSCIERGMRSERALKLAIAEMYFQGISTRKVKNVMEELCGFEITSTEVSQAAKLLDQELSEWRKRPLKRYRYLYLDAQYQKVRYGGRVRDCAILIAAGVDDSGKRDVLGLSVSLSEHEIHWREFLCQLQERGMHGVELIISDAHNGLKAARKAVFPGIPWQRCQFHLQQNAQTYVTRRSKKREVANVIKSILTAPDDATAKQLLRDAVKKYEHDMPKLSQWMEENVEESLQHFAFPAHHHVRIRTSNLLERLNKEVRRRTRKIGVFPNETSCERLVSAILVEIADDWQSGIRYLTF